MLLPTPAPNDDRGGPQPNRRVLDIPPAGNERVIVRWFLNDEKREKKLRNFWFFLFVRLVVEHRRACKKNDCPEHTLNLNVKQWLEDNNWWHVLSVPIQGLFLLQFDLIFCNVKIFCLIVMCYHMVLKKHVNYRHIQIMHWMQETLFIYWKNSKNCFFFLLRQIHWFIFIVIVDMGIVCLIWIVQPRVYREWVHTVMEKWVWKYFWKYLFIQILFQMKGFGVTKTSWQTSQWSFIIRSAK